MAIDKKIDVDPISVLYDELKLILAGMEVKFSGKANQFETFDTGRGADEYLDAYFKKDNFFLYEFTKKDYMDAGVYDEGKLTEYREKPYLVPEELQKKMLNMRREKIVSSYVEPNEYYRELAGLPPLSTNGGTIVTSQANMSLEVVPDNDEILMSDPTSHRISVSSAYNVMSTTLYEPGNHILVTSIGFQTEKTSSRSFYIVPDDIPITKDSRAIYVRDVNSIIYATGGHPVDAVDIVGKYAYIPLTHATDVTHFFTKGYLVVDDNDPDYDTNTMIKLSEAVLNNEHCIVGDRLYLGGFRYATMEHEEVYGISRKVPVHKIRDYYGSNFIYILQSSGYLDELAQKHPTEKYLKFIGTKRIPPHVSRKARNFDILYLPPTEREVIPWMFAIAYNGARDYFVNTVYNSNYRGVYDYYDNFIGLSIVQMAIQQTIAKAMKTVIDRDFYDETLLIWLFNMYDIPYCAQLPYQTQRRLAKNLNMLIQRKASNQVIYDIASILGYHDIQVYKYYLMKERKFNSNDELVYQDTLEYRVHMNSKGELVDDSVIVNYLEKMYDVYFQKVDLKETNFQNALTNSSNRVNYDDVTANDPLWWEDQDTFDEVYGDTTKYDAATEPTMYHKHYNFMETKYLGITISYKLSEVLYENIILLRLIFDLKKELETITLTLPKITKEMEVSLFDCIVFLCAMTSKQYHLTGEILTKYSTVMDVMGYINEDVDGYKPCDTLVFNFKLLTNADTYKEILKEPSKYLKDNEIETFMSYFSILTMDQPSVKEKTKAINELFTNIKGLGYFIGRKMSEASDINEYRTWRDFYDALFIGQENATMFNLGKSGRPATTYKEYLSVMNPMLYDVVESTEDVQIHSVIDHIIARIERIIPNLQTLYIVNDSNSALIDYLVKLIKFFKSYTTDLLDVTTQFIFDAKPDNLFKLCEWYKIFQVIVPKEAFKLMYSDVMRIIETRSETEHLRYEDTMISLKSDNEMRDDFSVGNGYQLECHSDRCKNFCKNDKESCNGFYKEGVETIHCRHYGYNTTGFKTFIDKYRDILMGLDFGTFATLEAAARYHMSCCYKAYIMMNTFNPFYDEEPGFSIPRLKELVNESLISLNNALVNYGYSITISSSGVDGIISWIDMLSTTDSSIEKGCQNKNYPCRAETCVNLHKYDKMEFKYTDYAKELIRYVEKMETITSSWLFDYMTISHDEVTLVSEEKEYTDDSGLMITDEYVSGSITAKLKDFKDSIYDTVHGMTGEDEISDEGIKYKEELIFTWEEKTYTDSIEEYNHQFDVVVE